MLRRLTSFEIMRRDLEWDRIGSALFWMGIGVALGCASMMVIESLCGVR